jgi:hypothetical protein
MKTIVLAAALFAASPCVLAQSPQEHVHMHGGDVMPFDLAKTVHIFRMTTDGGVQKVVLRGESKDAQQVQMIQHHLMMEAAQFRKGDFTDPARLHGPSMPGLHEMQQRASRMQVVYKALPDGAEIRFKARDIETITAIHRWFGAQLSEHGADARAE